MKLGLYDAEPISHLCATLCCLCVLSETLKCRHGATSHCCEGLMKWQRWRCFVSGKGQLHRSSSVWSFAILVRPAEGRGKHFRPGDSHRCAEPLLLMRAGFIDPLGVMQKKDWQPPSKHTPTLVLPSVTKPTAKMISVSPSKQTYIRHLLMTIAVGNLLMSGRCTGSFSSFTGAHLTPNNGRNKVTKEGFMISNLSWSRHIW